MIASHRVTLRPIAGIVAALGVAACTAGQYEIAYCDVSGNTQISDSCRELNSDNNGCTLYQCNKGTGRCELRPRDFDRDGDPDSVCGGKDCDDNNPAVNGAGSGTCACSPATLAQDCSRGVGACARKAKYECRNNTLSCPAVAGTPQDYGSSPDPVNGSWDYNCDGTDSPACCYQNSNGSRLCVACDVAACDPNVASAISSNNASGACNSYCSSKNKDNCPPADSPQLIRCRPECGSSIAICYCQWDNGLFGVGGSCKVQSGKSPVIDRVNCR